MPPPPQLRPSLTHPPGPTTRIVPTLGLLAAILLVQGCSRAPLVTVTNHSSHTLSNGVVSGTGFTESLPPLAPGGQHTLRVHPRGESGVRLACNAGPHPIDSGPQGYVEPRGGYRIQITVETNLAVSISSSLARP